MQARGEWDNISNFIEERNFILVLEALNTAIGEFETPMAQEQIESLRYFNSKVSGANRKSQVFFDFSSTRITHSSVVFDK